MTGLIAGIGLQGKAPLYEEYYKAGALQKQAQKKKKGEDYQAIRDTISNELDIDISKIHPHLRSTFQDYVEDNVAEMISMIDPNNPNESMNKVNRALREFNVNSQSFYDTSAGLFTLEDEKYANKHWVPNEFIQAVNNPEYEGSFGFMDQLGDDAKRIPIQYGINPQTGLPFLAFDNQGNQKIKSIDYFQDVLNERKGDWDAMATERSSIGNARYETTLRKIGKDEGMKILSDLAQNPAFANSAYFQTGIDISTPEGQERFFESYAPSELRQIRGGVSSSPNRDRSSYRYVENPSSIQVTTPGKDGEFQTFQIPVFEEYALPAKGSNVALNMDGSYAVGELERGEVFSELSGLGDDTPATPTAIISAQVWNGPALKIGEIKSSMSKTAYKELFGGYPADDIVIRKGMPVPNLLFEALGSNYDKYKSRSWFVKAETYEKGGGASGKATTIIIPYNASNRERINATYGDINLGGNPQSSPSKQVTPQGGGTDDARRADGTLKGGGYLGELKMKDGSGKVATEISIGIEIDGKETQIPTLVPTLSKEEVEWLLKGNDVLDGSKTAEQIIAKAVRHAKKRLSEGKSPFAGENPPAPQKSSASDRSYMEAIIEEGLDNF